MVPVVPKLPINNFRGLQIGLLGGSFNPPHYGHLAMSIQAIKYFDLDEVWWIVTPYNPLKHPSMLNSFNARLKLAKEFVNKHPKIRVTDFESRFKCGYTFQTIDLLQKFFADTNFIWIMGSDNLVQITGNNNWIDIFKLIPIAVIIRHKNELSALSSLAAKKFFISQRSYGNKVNWRGKKMWFFLLLKRNKISSTQIRQLNSAQ